ADVAVRLASIKMFFCHFIPLLQQKVYRFKSRSLKDFRYFGEHRKRYSPKLSHKFSKSRNNCKHFSLIFCKNGEFCGSSPSVLSVMGVNIIHKGVVSEKWRI
ncbi:MAG: hypothetical protein IKB43_05150, partial [Fibrobacter sp.]|nr:hypothetical protein [Fibrobacter sp.]